MAIHHPIPTTLHASDFQDKAYTFPLESVLSPEVIPGKLVVSISAGYLLTTEKTHQPRREQTLEYSRQPDGSWVVCCIVTLFLKGETPINGTVVIQNSLAEIVRLLIIATPIAIERLKMPTLTVSQPTLTFASTSPGRPSFLLLTVTQQHSEEPVTLTTDAPDHFQLATDSHPNFASTLTLVPSPIGTHVHVRYLTRKTGLYTGQLTIHSRLENKAVPLKGRTQGLLPRVINRPARNRPTYTKQWAKLLALVIASSLAAYVGYDNRCRLFPNLCQEMVVSIPINRVSLSAKIPIHSNKRTTEKPGRKPLQRDVTKVIEASVYPSPVIEPIDSSATQRSPNLVNRPQSVTTSRRVMPTLSTRSSSDDQEMNNAVNSQSYKRTTVTSPTQESELERVLNQTTSNQPNQ